MSDGERLFICLLASCVSSVGRCLVSSRGRDKAVPLVHLVAVRCPCAVCGDVDAAGHERI